MKRYTSTYAGTVINDAKTIKALRKIVKGSGFRIWFRGRGPRAVVLAKLGRYAAQSGFPLHLNPPKVALYLRSTNPHVDIYDMGRGIVSTFRTTKAKLDKAVEAFNVIASLT